MGNQANQAIQANRGSQNNQANRGSQNSQNNQIIYAVLGYLKLLFAVVTISIFFVVLAFLIQGIG